MPDGRRNLLAEMTVMAYFQDLSIRHKLTVLLLATATAVLLLATVTMVVSNWHNARKQMEREYSTLAKVVGAKSAAALTLGDLEADAAQSELADLRVAPTILFAALYGPSGKEVARYESGPAQTDRLTSYDEVGTRFVDGYLDVVQEVYAESDVNSSRIGTILLRATTKELNDQIRRNLLIMVIVFLVAVATAGLLSFVLQRAVSQPILTLATVSQRVASAHDYTVRAVKQGDDELGVLCDSFNAMLQQIEQKEAELEQTVRERDRTIQGVRQAVQQLSAMAEELMATISQQTAGVQQQASAVSQVVATVDEVAQTAEQAAERANEVAERSRQADQVGNRGRQAVKETMAAMVEVRQQVESLAENILTLAERAQAIGEITGTVSDIAEQTNVLALNAAVEASRAAEHGRGFAVVAAEVKSLAEQSKKATGQVRQILSEIQQATNTAVLSTEQGTKAVTKAGEVVANAGEVINMLSEIITNAARAATQISASASQQASGVVQLHEGIRNIDKVTKENSLAIEQVEQSAQNLNELSGELAKLVAV